MNRQDDINAKSQAELQKLIKEIYDGEVQVTDLKDLRRTANDRLRKVDPSAFSKRDIKTLNAMAALKEIKKQGKDLKQVQWGNSKESANYVLEKDKTLPIEKQKYKNWSVTEEDLDGDQYMDTIVKDGVGNSRIINGWTVTKTKYPERNIYTSANPRSQDRRAVRDSKTGKPVNFDVDENDNKIHGSERYLTKNKFKKDVLYNIDVDWNNGNAEYSHEYKNNKPLTPFKKFSNIIMKHYWYALIDNGYLNDIPKHLKSLFYIKLKANAWEFMKYWVIVKIMNLEYPEDKIKRQTLEKQPLFKQCLEQLVAEIISTDLNKTFNELRIAYDNTRKEILSEEEIEAYNPIKGYDGGERDALASFA